MRTYPDTKFGNFVQGIPLLLSYLSVQSWVITMIIFVILTQHGLSTIANSTGNPNLDHSKLILAVYSDGSFDWESAQVRHNGTHHPFSEVEFIQFQSRRQFSMDDIRKAAHLLEAHLQPITGIVGSYHDSIKTVAEDVAVPYLVTTGGGGGGGGSERGLGRDVYTFYMHPPWAALNEVVREVILTYGWDEAAVVHNDDRGIELIGQLMTSTRYFQLRGWKVPDLESLRTVLLTIRRLNIRNIIVVCEAEFLSKVLVEAKQLSMLSRLYSWLAVTLEPYKIDFSNYRFSYSNFTTFLLPGVNLSSRLKPPDLEDILVKDAICTLQMTLQHGYDSCEEGGECVVPGQRIQALLTNVSLSIEGRQIQFDESNKRTNVSFRILGLGDYGLTEIGEWYENRAHNVPLALNTSHLYADSSALYPLGREVIKIVTYVESPFVMRKKNYRELQGNARYEGYLIDLINEIAAILGFNYTLYESPDGNYGSIDDDGEWNGMMRELIMGNASMSLAALTISSERELYVDFTKPYKPKTLMVLVKRVPEEKSIFEFLWPLAWEVWVLMMVATLTLGVLLFLVDRLIPNSDIPDERFTLKESIWFMYGSIVGGGLDLGPRTWSGRLLTGTWWFFALIMVSSYTANLAAFLTVTKIDTPVNSLSDLVTQKTIKYGTVRNTNVHSFFRNSKLPIFQKMWNVMQVTDSLVENPDEAIRRVKEGNYAFIWDMPSLRYVTDHNCDTMMIGEPFDEKGYGIGVPLGASYRDDVTMAILAMNERNIMQDLEQKWWDNTSVCSHNRKVKGVASKELNLYSIAGVFVIVMGGAVSALIVSILECQYRLRHKPKPLPTPPVQIVNAVCDSDNEDHPEVPNRNQFGGYSVRYRKRMSVRNRNASIRKSHENLNMLDLSRRMSQEMSRAVSKENLNNLDLQKEKDYIHLGNTLAVNAAHI